MKKIHKLVYGDVDQTDSTPKSKKEIKNKKVIHENQQKVSEMASKADNMVEEIDGLLKEGELFNSERNDTEFEDIDVNLLETEGLDDEK